MIDLTTRRDCSFACLRWLCLVVILTTATAPLQAQQPGADAEPIRSAGEIDYPPFSIVDEYGQANGFSVELMRATAAAMGRTVTFRTGVWSEVRGWLAAGEVDALPLVGRTPERESIYDFTFPYMSLHGAIVVRTGTNDIHSLSDLRGRQVAVMKGDNAEEFLRRTNRGIDVRATPTFAQAMEELALGRHDAVFIQRLVALRLVRDLGLHDQLTIRGPIEEFRQDFCFAVREGDRDTLALLNEGLAIVMADGTYRRLHAKWFAALQLPEDRRLVIGGDRSFPPFEYIDENGRPAGFNVELTRAIAHEMGLDVEIRLGAWPEMREALRRGEIDALQGMFYSAERDATFDFTPPHVAVSYVAVVRAGEGPAPGKADELEGKSVVVQSNDIMHDWARERGLTEHLTAVASQEEALRAVREGRQDCALVARSTARYWMEKHGWDDLLVGQHALESLDYCYAVPGGHAALLAQLAEGLQTLEDSGEYRELYTKWMGVYEAGPHTLTEIARQVAVVLVPLLLLLLLSALWSWSLRRQVAVRTEELRASERLLATIMDAIPAPVFYRDAQERYLGCNAAFAEMVGLPCEEIIGRHQDGVPLEELSDEGNSDSAIMEMGEPHVYEAPVLSDGGIRREVSFHKAPFHGPDGAMVGIVGAMLDITERKRAEEELREFKAIFDNANFVAKITDTKGIIRYINRFCAEAYGYEPGELIGRPVQTLMSEEESADFMDIRAELLERGSIKAREVWHMHRDGTAIPMLMTGLLIREAHGAEDHFVFTLIDLSELKTVENQLKQIQRLDAIGRLAGGVAHDFNNMLLVIIGQTELMLESPDLPESLRAGLEDVRRAAERSADLTRQLLAFASRQTVSPRPLDLNDTVESMLKLLRRLIGENINIAWLPERALWAVRMDPTQVDQILANLCVNARDAISGAGKVTIETANRAFDEEYCATNPGAMVGEFVMLAVSDDGAGMDEETRERIFEPFFTTKGPSEGTGLGLATVYGIVRQNDGFINVYSEPGEGTTFRLYFPRHVADAVDEEPATEMAVPTNRGEVVLLVEDDPAILRMGRSMLEKQGYKVFAAETPREAIELVGDHAGCVDMLITDVVMPEMNGRELARRLQDLCPGLRVLFMSGYTANVIAHRGVLEEGVQFIQKPFSVEELARKMREVLDGPSS